MKKFTKICLITALVLAVAGAVLTGAGMVSGASFQKFAENMEKSGVGYTNKIYWLERIDERMEHFEDRVEHYSEKWEEKWDDDHWENEEAYTETRSFEVSRVECLIVEAYAGSIEIKPGTGDEIKISNLTDMDTVEFEEDDRELYVSRENEEDNQEALVIEIPEEKVFQELYLTSSASNVVVRGKIQAKETTLCAEAGKLKVELLDSRETDMECDAGKLIVKHTQKLADYTVDMETDACKVNLDRETYSGWQEGSFGAKNPDKHIDIEGNAGSIVISFE